MNYYIEYLDACISFVGLLCDNADKELKGKTIATQEILATTIAASEQNKKSKEAVNI